MSELTLNPEQRERAEELLERIEKGEIRRPTQLVDEWKPCPTWDEIETWCSRDEIEETEKWIQLSNVVGVDHELTDRFEEMRAERNLERLLDERFDPKYTNGPPHYMQIGDDAYVIGDGIHRTLTCKAVGVEKIYAKVTVVPPKPESITFRLRQWINQRLG